MILAAVGVFLGLRGKPPGSPTAATTTNSPSKSEAAAPKTLAELLALTPAQLASCDIGLMNLLCAEGLRGAEQLNVAEFVARLDGIARQVEFETKRAYYKFRNKPSDFENSEAYFQMLYLFTVLQQDVGIRYNPERITPVGVFESNQLFFADSRDALIHGLIAEDRRMGTCASLPVLYVAIGRRLGYPLKLARTKNHLFIRWQDSRERINFDATGRGMNLFDDNHYRRWPYPVSPEEEQEFDLLKSITPAEELTIFLALRGHCLMAMGKPKEAVAAHEAALRISPDSREQQLITANIRREAASRALADYIPLEQLQRGAFPAGVSSHRIEVERLVWQAQQAGRQRRGEMPQENLLPQGVPGVAPVIPPDPNPLLKLQDQFKTQ